MGERARGTEKKTRLAGVGFRDLAGAERWLASPELSQIDHQQVLRGLALAPAPDMALKSAVRLMTENHTVVGPLLERGPDAVAFYRLLGASSALGEFLLRRPQHLALFDQDPADFPESGDQELSGIYRAQLLEAVGARPAEAAPVAQGSFEEATEALRVAYRGLLVRIAVADLCASSPQEIMPRIGAALADLAGAAVEAALAVARAQVRQTEPLADAVTLSVIGMGKCGARELNYISDVDVIYAVGTEQTDPQAPDEQAQVRIGTALVKHLTKAVYGVGKEPGLWEVDANLRPEGKDGPLVRTVASHREYYKKWAENWEFQALLKARPLAGSPELGERYMEAIRPFVWAAAGRKNFVDSVQAMRHRVTDNIPAEEKDRQIKLGPGGLRDIEFTVQLLQLVHGRTDEEVRTRSTTESLSALASRSYIGREDAAAFAADYRWLRVLEHRIQLLHLRRTHLMPTKDAEQAAVARAVRGLGDPEKGTVEELERIWKRVKLQVRGLHERLFFRPLLAAVAHLSADQVALTTEAAKDRLAALGYLDPKGAMRHIEALTTGVSRRAEIQRNILPVLLGWFAQGVSPDAGLLGFRRISETLGQTHWYLRMLRDSPAAAERLCAILSGSRFITDLLEDEPESIAWLDHDDQLQPVAFEHLWTEIQAKIHRHPDAPSAARMLRLIRRREILRIAMGEVTGVTAQEQIMQGLAETDQATVLGALHAAERELYQEQGKQVATDVAVIAMGRQGGGEIGYGSDADVLFVHQPREGASEEAAAAQAARLVERTTQLLKMPMKPGIRAEKVLEIDADLRPEGRSGPMVRSLGSYAEYYQRWADTWEYQALLRARPMAGSAEVAERFVRLIEPYRYPQEFPDERVREVRRMKARVEAERMPRGADPARQVKLGRGGLSDVEWLVQLLQLLHAHRHPELKTTSTLQALEESVHLGLIPAESAEVLAKAWRLATRIRGCTVLRSGRASDSLPSDVKDLEAMARWSGYGPGQGRFFEEDYLKTTRRARAVYEKLFYENPVG